MQILVETTTVISFVCVELTILRANSCNSHFPDSTSEDSRENIRSLANILKLTYFWAEEGINKSITLK